MIIIGINKAGIETLLVLSILDIYYVWYFYCILSMLLQIIRACVGMTLYELGIMFHTIPWQYWWQSPNKYLMVLFCMLVNCIYNEPCNSGTRRISFVCAKVIKSVKSVSSTPLVTILVTKLPWLPFCDCTHLLFHLILWFLLFVSFSFYLRRSDFNSFYLFDHRY